MRLDIFCTVGVVDFYLRLAVEIMRVDARRYTRVGNPVSTRALIPRMGTKSAILVSRKSRATIACGSAQPSQTRVEGEVGLIGTGGVSECA
jgi:hypothetical protein